jgi:RNA polymerase sigma factor (sigma-70 family)
MILEDGLAEMAAVEPKMAELEPYVKAQYQLILKLCRKRMRHSEEATDVAQASFSKFLKEIYIYVFCSGAASFCSGAASVNYPAWRKFRKPEAWLTRIVMNTFKDFVKTKSRRLKNCHYFHELPLSRKATVDGDVAEGEVIDDPRKSVDRTPWSNPESRMLRLEQQAADRAFVTAYRSVLPRVSLPRLRAWVLCNDEFLQPDEAEKLLKLKSARAAKAAWPRGMPIKEAARLLRCAEGTVSSNVSRARENLGRELADLDPLKASRAPVRKWHEFLGSPFGVRGSLEQIVFATAPLLGPLPVTVCAGPALPPRPASDLIVDYARAIRRPLPIPAGKVCVAKPALEVDLNNRARRVNLPFPKGLKRISYWSGSYRKGSRNCGETKRIRTKKGRRKAVYKSGHAVFRAYAPNETGWTFWCYECGARDEQCWPIATANSDSQLSSDRNRSLFTRPKSLKTAHVREEQLMFRRRRTLIPKGRRTAFRAEGEQFSERSDAGNSIVQEVFAFVKRNLSGAQRR